MWASSGEAASRAKRSYVYWYFPLLKLLRINMGGSRIGKRYVN